MNSLFFSDEYLNAVVPGQKWALSEVKENGRVVGQLYYRVVEKYGFRRLENIPLTPAINGLIDVSEGKQVTQKRKQRRILLELFEQLQPYDDLDINLGVHIHDWRSLYWAGYKQTTRYTSVFKPEMLSDLEANYKRELAKRIRKAKEGLHFTLSEDSKGVYDLIQKTYGRKNDQISFTRETFENTCAVFKKHGRLKIWSAFRNEKIIGVLVFFEDNMTSYLMFSGLDPAYKKHGSQAYLTHVGIKNALSRGLTVDMEGSMIQTIDEFNLAFNPCIVGYHRIQRAKSKILQLYKLLR